MWGKGGKHYARRVAVWTYRVQGEDGLCFDIVVMREHKPSDPFPAGKEHFSKISGDVAMWFGSVQCH